jgi:hypothetical protein
MDGEIIHLFFLKKNLKKKIKKILKGTSWNLIKLKFNFFNFYFKKLGDGTTISRNIPTLIKNNLLNGGEVINNIFCGLKKKIKKKKNLKIKI